MGTVGSVDISPANQLRMQALQMAQVMDKGAIDLDDLLDGAEAIYQFIIKEDVEDNG